MDGMERLRCGKWEGNNDLVFLKLYDASEPPGRFVKTDFWANGFIFLTSLCVTLMLLSQGPNFENRDCNPYSPNSE